MGTAAPATLQLHAFAALVLELAPKLTFGFPGTFASHVIRSNGLPCFRATATKPCSGRSEVDEDSAEAGVEVKDIERKQSHSRAAGGQNEGIEGDQVGEERVRS